MICFEKIATVVMVALVLGFSVIAISEIEDQNKQKQIEIDKSSSIRIDSRGTTVKTLCVDGFKMLVTQTPGLYGESKLVQLFVEKNGKSVPAMCEQPDVTQ